MSPREWYTFFKSKGVEEQVDILTGVSLPDKTKTYEPVSHYDVITKSAKMMKDAGHTIEKVRYDAADSGEVMLGWLTTAPELVEGHKISNVMGFQNSYNKRYTLKLSFGTHFHEEDVSIMHSNIRFKRKHTGTVNEEFDKLLVDSAGYLTSDYEDMIGAMDYMKHSKMGKDNVGKALGQLYLTADVLNSSQMSRIKRAATKVKKSVFDEYGLISVWSLFSIVEETLRDSHAASQIDDYIKTFDFFKTKYGII